MGALSRSGLQRVFIGNTAERILGSLACDVLVVKPANSRRSVAHETRGMRVRRRRPGLLTVRCDYLPLMELRSGLTRER